MTTRTPADAQRPAAPDDVRSAVERHLGGPVRARKVLAPRSGEKVRVIDREGLRRLVRQAADDLVEKRLARMRENGELPEGETAPAGEAGEETARDRPDLPADALDPIRDAIREMREEVRAVRAETEEVRAALDEVRRAPALPGAAALASGELPEGESPADPDEPEGREAPDGETAPGGEDLGVRSFGFGGDGPEEASGDPAEEGTALRAAAEDLVGANRRLLEDRERLLRDRAALMGQLRDMTRRLEKAGDRAESLGAAVDLEEIEQDDTSERLDRIEAQVSRIADHLEKGGAPPASPSPPSGRSESARPASRRANRPSPGGSSSGPPEDSAKRAVLHKLVEDNKKLRDLIAQDD